MTATLTAPLEVIEQQLETSDEPGKAAHIVLETDNKTAHALVLEARIYGTEVEALCGYRWVPSRNPESLPVCDTCLEIYQGAVKPGDRDNLPDA